MKKILLLLPILFFALGFVACSDDDNEDMRIELASPEPKVKTDLAVATFSWADIDKTGGYAYALDASEDYTVVDASTTEVTISGISNGSHTFKIYAVGVEGKSFNSAIRELEFSVNSTIATPALSYTINTVSETKSEVVVKWNKVNGAKGYAYKVRDAQTWTEVGENVLSATIKDVANGDKFPFTIKALGNPPSSEDSEMVTITINLETAVGMWVIFNKDEDPADPVEMKETTAGSGIYETTVSCLASDAFFINIENKKHGFMSFSGNGGVGTVNSEFATAPFYNRGVYYIREAVGLMSTGATINDFYTNVDAACKVFVQVDTNGEKPSYYLRLVDEKPDASIVLAQYFDLMAYGGDWATPCKGTSYVDGTTISPTGTGLVEGKKDGASTTSFAAQLTETDFAPAYIKNRGIEGWSFEYLFEFAGYIRLSNTTGNTQYGVLTSPKLGVAGKMEVTFDGLLFAAFRDEGADGFIEVKVLNGGKITSVNVVKDGEGAAVTIQPVGDNSFHVLSKYHTDYANAAAKKWSTYTFVIEGATADTQITWNSKTDTSISSKHYRYCLDNIVVKKK